MNFRRALHMVVFTLGLAGCVSYPYSRAGIGYYDDGYYGGGYGYYDDGYYYPYRPRYGYYENYYGYGGYPYFGWSAFYPFNGYCPARYRYCPPFGFSAYVDPYYYGFGLFMPYGYVGWYDPFWNGYRYPPQHHGDGHSHDHQGDHHQGDDRGDQDHARPPADDGGAPPPRPPGSYPRRGTSYPLPRPKPTAEDTGAGEQTDTLVRPIPPPYRQPPTTPRPYRPPGVTPPPGRSSQEPNRREVPAPEPRPKAQDSSDDSDEGKPRRGSGRHPSPGGASNN